MLVVANTEEDDDPPKYTVAASKSAMRHVYTGGIFYLSSFTYRYSKLSQVPQVITEQVIFTKVI